MLLQPAPAVTALQSIVVALATPLLLLSADLSVIFKRTGLMLRAFVCGAIGTALGALLGFWLVRAHCIFSAHAYAEHMRAREADILLAVNLQHMYSLLLQTCSVCNHYFSHVIAIFHVLHPSTVTLTLQRLFSTYHVCRQQREDYLTRTLQPALCPWIALF
jgi:hypothetical protein